MSAFKEQVANDIYNVFLNLDEFAEEHLIEGKTIPVVIDDDDLTEKKKGQILGIVEADMLIYGKASDFPKYMNNGRFLNVDNREMIVVKSAYDMGMIEVALQQSRSS